MLMIMAMISIHHDTLAVITMVLVIMMVICSMTSMMVMPIMISFGRQVVQAVTCFPKQAAPHEFGCQRPQVQV